MRERDYTEAFYARVLKSNINDKANAQRIHPPHYVLDVLSLKIMCNDIRALSYIRKRINSSVLTLILHILI